MEENKNYPNKSMKIAFAFIIIMVFVLITIFYGILLEEKQLNKKVNELGCRAWIEARIQGGEKILTNWNVFDNFTIINNNYSNITNSLP